MSKKKIRTNRTHKRIGRKRGHWQDSAPEAAPLESGAYPPIDPRLTTIVCPDCGVSWTAPDRQRRAGVGGSMEHAPTCPIGRGYAEAATDDRLWFEAHVGETERVRPPTMAEIQAVMLSTGQSLPDMPHGGRYEPGGQVIVTKHSEALRSRDFRGVILFAQPVLPPIAGEQDGRPYDADEYDSDGVRWFREHLFHTDEGQWQ